MSEPTRASEFSSALLAGLLLSLVRPSSPVGLSKIRIGNQHGDGGYVMLDDWQDVVGAVSIGIGGDVSWDLAIAERGIDVHQYDHTVHGPPTSHPRFHFHSIGVGGGASVDAALRSLEQIVADIPLDGDLVLKMDVEGAEWAALPIAHSPVMNRFAQIVIEAHAPLAGTAADRLRNVGVLSTLRRTHEVVHVHANNYAPVESFGGVRVPSVLEISYVRRTRTSFRASNEPLPAPEDVPNDPSRPEIEMRSILAQTDDSSSVMPSPRRAPDASGSPTE